MLNFKIKKGSELEGDFWPDDLYAVYENGLKPSRIQVDGNGNMHFMVRNPQTGKSHFNGYIKDAVEMMVNGCGDYISTGESGINPVYVFYYLDRELGEQKRKETIEKWKDVEFGYALQIHIPDFNYRSVLARNGKAISAPEMENVSEEMYKTKNQEEAEKLMKSWIKKAKKAKEYMEKHDLNPEKDDDMFQYFIRKPQKNIDHDLLYMLILFLRDGAVIGKEVKKPNNKVSYLKWKVIQCVM